MNNNYHKYTGSNMAILQVRDLDDRLYSTLKSVAKSENRSISQEVISIIEKYLTNPQVFSNNPTREFISLSDSWDDVRSADEIINSIRSSRKKSKRFSSENVIFD